MNKFQNFNKRNHKIISALDNTPTGEKGTEYLKQYFDVIRFKLPNSIKDIGDLDKFHFNYCWMNIKKTNTKGRKQMTEKEAFLMQSNLILQNQEAISKPVWY